jgi:hypothetical protein
LRRQAREHEFEGGRNDDLHRRREQQDDRKVQINT